MKYIWALAGMALVFGGCAFADEQHIDCSTPRACIQPEADLEFAKLEVKSVKEEWKNYPWGDAYREVTLTVFGYFSTLLAGRPIIGEESQNGGRVLFIMGPTSDLDAPSWVINRFLIRGGKEKIRVYSYQGNLQDHQTIFLGEF